MNYNAKIFRGKILTEQKRPDAAEWDFRSCIEIDPSKPLGYQALSSLFHQLKRWQDFIGTLT